MNLNGRLVVSRSGEYLTFLGWNGGVALDKTGTYTAQSFDTKGKWGHVKQQHVLDLAAQYTALNGSTDCNTFVRVDALKAFLAGDVLDCFLNCWDTGGTANEENLFKVTCL